MASQGMGVNVLHVRNSGVPIVGFTWLLVSPTKLTGTPHFARKAGRVNPLGLYDLDRNIRNRWAEPTNS